MVVENLKGQPVVLQPQGGPPESLDRFFELKEPGATGLALERTPSMNPGDLVKPARSGERPGSYLLSPTPAIQFWPRNHDHVDRVEISCLRKKETLANLGRDRDLQIKRSKDCFAPRLYPPTSLLHLLSDS